ncbi:MAG: hypothetical protein IJB71_00350 [Bacilli bacterium]|nr:hypothetical protein [Bacilli bacterium]
MQKNGFTLIEAIGIIIVIALVSLVTVPIIIQSTDKNREMEQLCLDAKFASETYIAMKKGSIPALTTPGESLTINLKDLVKEGLLNDINVESGQTIIITTNSDYTYRMECSFGE